MRLYPAINDSKNDTLKTAYDFMQRERIADVTDFNNLPNRFVAGRKVNVVPSGTTQALVTDRPGDVNYDTSYLYICESVGSTARWLRASLSTW